MAQCATTDATPEPVFCLKHPVLKYTITSSEYTRGAIFIALAMSTGCGTMTSRFLTKIEQEI
jgi:hypothetical protein